MNFINIMTISITLFAVIDMLGNVPLIIRLKKEGGIESLKSTIISVVIMISTLFLGKTLFNLLGIETYHFGLAGSFLILYFGVKMVLGIGEDPKKQTKRILKATVFPVAFPLISGPGTLSTIISMRTEFSDPEIIIGILINALIIFVVLKSSNFIERKIGENGITLLERIFGIILIAIGMKMLLFNLIMSIDSIVPIT